MPQLSDALYPAAWLPERVLQFGTGVLLRGLPDYFIDKANKQGIFNGTIVVVKSTGGATDEFATQNNRYTLAVRGIENGQDVHEDTVITAISRVVSAQTQWREVLNVAKNPALQVIISNTTEVGLTYVEESIFQSPPASFPAKLTAFLYERFKDVGGSRNRGLVVIPTELVTDNGLKLREMVEALAKYNELGRLFMKWLKFHVRFCNSLVDRIVPGKPDADTLAAMQTKLGYTDALLTVAEPYRLWAIEGDERVRDILSFAQVDSGVIIEEDITFYRERKLRLLNGVHTLTVPMAYLLGFETVYEANRDPAMSAFIRQLMHDEVLPTVPDVGLPGMDAAAISTFAGDVLERWLNPHIEHLLLNITVEHTAKMQSRNVKTLQRYYRKFNAVPPLMALGLAGYLRFMRAVRLEEGQYLGEIETEAGVITYPIRDAQAAYFYDRWQAVNPTDATSVRALVLAVLADEQRWQANLTALPGFADAVAISLTELLTIGPAATLARYIQPVQSLPNS
jgi:tagaturonate reductase